MAKGERREGKQGEAGRKARPSPLCLVRLVCTSSTLTWVETAMGGAVTGGIDARRVPKKPLLRKGFFACKPKNPCAIRPFHDPRICEPYERLPD